MLASTGNAAVAIMMTMITLLLFSVLMPSSYYYASAQEQKCGSAGSITSNNYSNENYPYYAFDNNTQTRWENPGHGSWVKYRFEYNVLLTSVDIAWHKGNEKVYSFGIQTADNATTDFQTVFSANSSGSTTGFEHYDFNDTPTDRVKIQVYDNNVDNLASIAEIRLGALVNGSNPLYGSSLKVIPAESIVASADLPSAEHVWHNETFYVPSNVSNFVMLIPNEGHHINPQEQLSPKNGQFLPSHIIISQNTALSVLNDDNDHCHTIWITNLKEEDSGGAIYAKTEIIPDGSASNHTMQFNSTGIFKLLDPTEPVMQSTIIVYNATEREELQRSHNDAGGENITVGAIYVPQGNLTQYKQMFTDANFKIESEYDFEWNNTNNEVKAHTLLIYSTIDPLENALSELSMIAKKTPYT